MVEQERHPDCLIRIFTCIEIPAPRRAQIARLQEALPCDAGTLTLVAPRNLHVTLRFFGNLTNTQIRTVSAAVEGTAKDFDPFEISIGSVGAFQNAQRPRVIWAGVRDGAETLVRMYGHLEGALQAVGFEAGANPFTAHVTLARMRSNTTVRTMQRISAAVESLQRDHHLSVPVAVDNITVMKSEITRGGRLYTPVLRAALRKISL